MSILHASNASQTQLPGDKPPAKRHRRGKHSLTLLPASALVAALLLILIWITLHFGRRALRPGQNAFKVAFYRTDPDLIGRHGLHYPSPECCSASACTQPRTGRSAIITYLRDDTYMNLFRQMECTLRKSNPDVELVIMVVKGELSPSVMTEFTTLNVTVRYVQPLDFPNYYEPRYGRNWMKIRAWDLTEWDALLLIDSDVAVVGQVTELFALPTNFAGVGDQTKWLGRWKTQVTGVLNGGVLFLRPCRATASHMLQLVQEHPKLQFRHGAAEQEFFNWYFKYNAFTLPLEYNAMAGPTLEGNLTVGGRSPKIVHFTEFKPFNGDQGLPGHEFLCTSAQLAARVDQ